MQNAESQGLVPFILYQRTEFLRFGNSRILKRLLPYKFLVNLDSHLFSKQVVEEYESDILKEWLNISPHLPERVSCSMDIGCGVGFINAFLFKRYHREDAPLDLFLVDKNEVAKKVYYEFEPVGAAYNCLSNSRCYLTSRGVDGDCLHTINVNEEQLPNDRKFDLVLSLLSWGYHYPLETYLDYVRDHLAPEGTLIVDCNTKSSGLDLLKRDFDFEVIKKEPSYNRVKAQKKMR